jgi:hypothetical protein
MASGPCAHIEAIATVKQPASNYQAAATAPNIHDLDLAVAVLECAPRDIVNAETEADYTCA